MIKTTLVVPVADNDGSAFDRSAWRELESRLMQWGGLTRDSDVTGGWTDGDRTYRDRSRRYVVALASWWDLSAWLAVVDWAGRRFRQEAMFVEVAGIPEIRTVR